MDLSKLSDEELKQLAAQPQKTDLSKISDDDLLKMHADATKGQGNGLIEGSLRALPFAGGLAGGVLGSAGGPVGSVAGAGAGGYAGKSVENMARGFLGSPYSDSLPKADTSLGRMAAVIGQNLSAVPEQAGNEMGGQIIGAAAGVLKKFAEKAAVNATGATGKQASNFADNAGRELLDRNIVGFGNSQSEIATKASAAVDQANAQIDSSLKALQEQGVKVDSNKIYDVIQNKINTLKSDPSQAPVVKKLESILEDTIDATAANKSTDYGIGNAEKIKRGYNKIAGNWMEPTTGQAGKEAYLTWRDAVENAAQKANPDLASQFEEGKKSYGMLRPIEEATERRAATTQQHPVGGLLDTAAMAGGAAFHGVPTGLASVVGRRLIAPRTSSALAVSADQLVKSGLLKPGGQLTTQGAQGLLQMLEQRK